LLCLGWCQWDVLCLWRGSPGPPLPPLGAGSQQLCLPCSGVSGRRSCLWRGSSGPPSPGGGRQSLPCSASHVSVVCFLIWHYIGPPARSSLTLWGEATPPPTFIQNSFYQRACYPIHSQPSGGQCIQAPCSHTIRWGLLTLFNRVISESLVHSRGGRGAGHALPHPPTPPFPHLGVGGGTR